MTATIRQGIPDPRLIEMELAQIISAAHVPGFSVDLDIRGNRVSMAVGNIAVDEKLPMTGEARFRLTCLIRYLTSLLILQLCDEGLISIEAPIGHYLPELGGSPGSKGDNILVRHLLSHTGGYQGLNLSDHATWRDWQWEGFAEFLKNAPQLFSPGTVFSEEHIDHIILGRIVNAVTGQEVEHLIGERILAPLGITPGRYLDETEHPRRKVRGHEFSASRGAIEKVENASRPSLLCAPSLSDMTLSARDMVTIAASLARGIGPFRGGLLEKAMTPVVALPRVIGPRQNPNWAVSGFGLCCATFSNGCIGHFASGYGQSWAIVSDHVNDVHIGMAVNLAATPLRAFVLDRLLFHVLGRPAARLGQEFPPADAHMDFHAFFKPFLPKDLIGSYVGNPGPIAVGANPSTVFIANPDWNISLRALQRNRLAMESRGPSIAIFSDPTSGSPCLMLAMNAYKKIASR